MIKIVVDSASDITQSEAESLGVSLISMRVRFGEEEFSDGVDITHREFYEKLIESDALPQTSQINEFCWAERFDELLKDADEVLAITISSKLSGTYVSAAAAAKKFGTRVRVVDSLSACIGERILCMYALRLIRDHGIDDAERLLNENKNKMQVLALLDTLHYLKMGGRISAATAFAGELLSIKPVVCIADGEVKLVGKALGSKRGNNLLAQLVEKCGGINFDMPYALGFTGLDDKLLVKYIGDSERLWKGRVDSLPVFAIGSTIDTHVGPGAIAVAFFGE